MISKRVAMTPLKDLGERNADRITWNPDFDELDQLGEGTCFADIGRHRYPQWTEVVSARPVEVAVLIEPVPGALWPIKARLEQDWPEATIHVARNWVEGCLLVGRLGPDFVGLSTEVSGLDVISLIQSVFATHMTTRPIVILATASVPVVPTLV